MRDETYEETTWPDGYWPHDPEGSAREWDAQVTAFHADLDALLKLLDDPATDLLAVVPNGRRADRRGCVNSCWLLITLPTTWDSSGCCVGCCRRIDQHPRADP